MQDILKPRGVTGAVMFHIGRCGSTVLADMFGRLPATRSMGELYTTYERQGISAQGVSPQDYTVARLIKAADRLKKPPAVMRKTPPVLVFEVKFLSSLDMRMFPEGLAAYVASLVALGVTKAIVLNRRNLLRRMVSTSVALKRADYHLRAGEQTEVPRVELALTGLYLGTQGSLLDIFDMIDREYDQLREVCRSAGLEMLDLDYEQDIQNDPQVALVKMCHLFGRDVVEIPPAFERINSSSLTEVLTNFPAVAAVLQGTRHEWMLDAV